MKSENMELEACVETFEEAMEAWQRGATRIELCADLSQDGLTPAAAVLQKTCASLPIPVMAMVRPRGGDFVYSPAEVAQMEEEIARVKTLGAAGIVLGLLTPGNRVDVENTRRLAEAARPLPVTFHKAIDRMEDPAEGVRQLRTIPGISRILTSGGKITAREGVPKIREMIAEAGDRIIILVAGRVTSENLAEIRQLTGAAEFHGRKIVGELR